LVKSRFIHDEVDLRNAPELGELLLCRRDVDKREIAAEGASRGLAVETVVTLKRLRSAPTNKTISLPTLMLCAALAIRSVLWPAGRE
jgi:hypothetical protein